MKLRSHYEHLQARILEMIETRDAVRASADYEVFRAAEEDVDGIPTHKHCLQFCKPGFRGLGVSPRASAVRMDSIRSAMAVRMAGFRRLGGALT